MSLYRAIRSRLPQEIPGLLAVIYEKFAVPGLSEFHCRVASEVSSLLTRGRLLDVGTGPGRLLVEIARRSPDLDLVGIDLSRKMLQIAEKATRRRARLARADVLDLPFPDGTFDLVVSTLSLHHWRDPAKGIRECLRVTAPGGRCLIYDLRTDVPIGAYARLVTGRWLARWTRSVVFKFHGVNPKHYDADSIASWIEGMASVRIETHAAYLTLSLHKIPQPARSHASAGVLSGPVDENISTQSPARSSALPA